MNDVSQDLLLLNELVLVQHLLLPQVMIMLFLVLLQFIQGTLQRPAERELFMLLYTFLESKFSFTSTEIKSMRKPTVFITGVELQAAVPASAGRGPHVFF